MLETLRTRTSGWMAGLILGVVTVPFLFFGINNYFSGDSATYVAKVGKAEIGPDQFRTRLSDERNRAQSELGSGFDPAMFEDPMRKRALLDRMVEEELLLQAARDAGAEMTDGRLKQEIENLEPFQKDGKFDPIQYQILLQTRQMTPQGFQEMMRRDLTLREIPRQLEATAAVSDREVDRYLALEGQSRDLRYFLVPAAAPKPPTAPEIAKYYREHTSEFMSEEQVAVDYVILDAAALKIDTTPDEATLRSRFEEQKASFVVGEQRLASHILIAVAESADAKAQKSAATRAAALLAEIRAGKSFAETASAASDDAGSKTSGGDLGWLETGMTDPAFEKALFALAPNQISEPVRGAEGYHLIQLREVKPGSSKSFDEVREQLAQQVLESERERVFSDRSGELIDQVYADPTSLEAAADSLKLKVERTALFSRGGGAGITSNPKVVEAAYSDAVLTEGNVSDAIDLGPNRIVLIKQAEHKPRALRPLKDVGNQVASRVQAAKAADDVRARARALEKDLMGGATLAAVATRAGVEITDAPGVSRKALNHDLEIVKAVFKLARPSANKPTRALLTLPQDRYALVEITRVQEGDPAKADKQAREQARTLMRAALATSETRAFIDSLRKRSEVKIAEDRL
ncbi:MAG: SurA N-terminal domain-containing protein, partial [Lysobacterales bacterium]